MAVSTIPVVLAACSPAVSAAVSTIPILAACSPADDERPLGKTQDTGMAPGHPGRANTTHTDAEMENVLETGDCAGKMANIYCDGFWC